MVCFHSATRVCTSQGVIQRGCTGISPLPQEKFPSPRVIRNPVIVSFVITVNRETFVVKIISLW